MNKRDHAEPEKRQTVQRKSDKKPQEVREYWTADRLRSAAPVEIERQKPSDREVDEMSNP